MKWNQALFLSINLYASSINLNSKIKLYPSFYNMRLVGSL